MVKNSLTSHTLSNAHLYIVTVRNQYKAFSKCNTIPKHCNVIYHTYSYNYICKGYFADLRSGSRTAFSNTLLMAFNSWTLVISMSFFLLLSSKSV